ncbi:MAG: heme exporter protein CcmB [Coriobacteriia bacterium]|nr:heme exporter protein CcmB [Coriobacteriia bacterium]
MRQFFALLKKDLLLEARSKSMVASMTIYAVLVLVVYGATISQTSDSFNIQQVAPGLLWALIVFTSLIGLNKTFEHEHEEGAMVALLLSPMQKSLIFLSKFTANLLFLLLVELIAVPEFFFFFLQTAQVSGQSFLLVLPLLLGSIGISGVGTLLATITQGAKSSNILLTILLVPLIFPLLLLCVSTTSMALLGSNLLDAGFYRLLGMAATYDLIMLAAAYGLYEFVVSP